MPWAWCWNVMLSTWLHSCSHMTYVAMFISHHFNIPSEHWPWIKYVSRSNLGMSCTDLYVEIIPDSKDSWAPQWATWAWWAMACHSEINVGPTWSKHWEFRGQPLHNLHWAHRWLTMDITWAKTMGMLYIKILLYQCVVKQLYYIGTFMGRPMCAPLNTNEWQNSGFTWAISGAN